MGQTRARSGGCRRRIEAPVIDQLRGIFQQPEIRGLAPSYVSGILRLTLLAPEIVEAILDGRQPAELQLAGWL
jgi:hypothetical protein